LGSHWITADWGASENNWRARFYTLTRAGRRQLTVELSKWERLSAGVAFSLSPRRNVKPRRREGRDMPHFSATAWVSESDFELVRLEVVAIHTVKMGLGVGLFARLDKGASLTSVRRKINGEVWLPATAVYEGSARLGLVRVIRQRGESEFSNYRKFTVDTQSSFVPPPVKL
jgi:hypothetical protein